MSATIEINGAVARLAVATLAELLGEQGVAPDARGVAVAVNGAVVPRRDWASAGLRPGDKVDIVKPFSGG